MYQHQRSVALIRLITMLIAGAVILTGVTFAILRSNAVMLEGSTISSATAHLSLSNDGQTYSQNVPGFEFGGIEPGGALLPGRNVYFKNEGTSTIQLGINLSTVLINSNQMRLDQVFLVLTPQGGGATERHSFAALYDEYANGRMLPLNAQLAPGQVFNYTMQIEMSASAVSSDQSTATLRNVNFLFIGSSVNG